MCTKIERKISTQKYMILKGEYRYQYSIGSITTFLFIGRHSSFIFISGHLHFDLDRTSDIFLDVGRIEDY